MIAVEKKKLEIVSNKFPKSVVIKDSDIPQVIIETGHAKLLLPEVIEGGSEVHTFYTNRGKKHASLDLNVNPTVQKRKEQLKQAVLALDVAFEYESQLLDVFYYGADGILKKTMYNVKPEESFAYVDVTQTLKNNAVDGFKVELYSPEGEARVTVGAVKLMTTFEDDQSIVPDPKKLFIKHPQPPRPDADQTKPDDDDEEEEGAPGAGADSGGGIVRAPPALATESSSGLEAEVTAEETAGSPLNSGDIIEDVPVFEQESSPLTGAAIAELAKKNWPFGFIVLIMMIIFGRHVYRTVRKRGV